MSSLGRLVQGLYFIVVGVAFGVQGAIMLQHPDYWDPITDLDYAAVWMYSLVLLLSAPAFVLLVRQAQAGRAAFNLAWIIAGAAVLTAIANVFEDAFDLKGFGFLYLVGALPFFFGQAVLAIMLGAGDRKAFALVPALTFLGALAINNGGGILIGATWAVFGILVLVGRTAPASTGGGR